MKASTKTKRVKILGGLLVALFAFSLLAQSCAMTTACGTTKGQANSKHKKWK
jgi:hypothetical protein